MKTIYLTLLLMMLTLAMSCKKFVALDPPRTKLTDQTVYKSNQTATSALTSIYTQLGYQYNFPSTISLVSGLYSDELTSYATSPICTQPYLNALRAEDAPSTVIWTTAYALIYQCNAVYQGCASSNTITQDVKTQLMAESRFIRAYLYFYLVNLFGDVPLITSTDYKLNAVMGRTSTATVYDQIISDLIYAQQNLSPNYVEVTSTGSSSERLRANQAAATALLSRVYLYLQRYSDAEQQATQVISNTALYDTVPVEQVFLKNNKEAIWQLNLPTPFDGANTSEATVYIIQSIPQTDVEQSSVISKALYQLFEPGDLRKSTWIGTATDGSVPAAEYKYPWKYKVRNSDTPQEYSTPIRLAELYLIRAEARVMQNQLSGTLADLDVVRTRAGLTPLKVSNPNLTKPELLKLIAEERQRELFCEYGHRWMDLKRTGKVHEVMQVTAPLKGGSWNSSKQLWPIPLTDIQNNPAIQQNPGYN